LRQKEEQLRLIDNKIGELETRSKFSLDSLQGDYQRLKEENKRKIDHFASLGQDKIILEESNRKVSAECRILESDI